MQLSATSHTPPDARHTVAADAKPSAGQSAPAPVQLSAASHVLTAVRHTVVVG